MAKKKRDLSKSKSRSALTGIPVGTPVDFRYRGAKDPHGTVAGKVPGGTKGDPMESVRPAADSRHPGEPPLIHRRASKLRRRG